MTSTRTSTATATKRTSRILITSTDPELPLDDAKAGVSPVDGAAVDGTLVADVLALPVLAVDVNPVVTAGVAVADRTDCRSRQRKQ
jgi:hypothetical protein